MVIDKFYVLWCAGRGYITSFYPNRGFFFHADNPFEDDVMKLTIGKAQNKLKRLREAFPQQEFKMVRVHIVTEPMED